MFGCLGWIGWSHLHASCSGVYLGPSYCYASQPFGSAWHGLSLSLLLVCCLVPVLPLLLMGGLLQPNALLGLLFYLIAIWLLLCLAAIVGVLICWLVLLPVVVAHSVLFLLFLLELIWRLWSHNSCLCLLGLKELSPALIGVVFFGSPSGASYYYAYCCWLIGSTLLLLCWMVVHARCWLHSWNALLWSFACVLVMS